MTRTACVYIPLGEKVMCLPLDQKLSVAQPIKSNTPSLSEKNKPNTQSIPLHSTIMQYSTTLLSLLTVISAASAQSQVSTMPGARGDGMVNQGYSDLKSSDMRSMTFALDSIPRTQNLFASKVRTDD